MQKKFDKNRNKNFFKVNFQIKSPYVRVVRDDEQMGILPVDKARRIAQELNLDLVEVVPQAQPPVCKIINFDKFRYEQKQKEKDLKKKQKTNEIKQIRFRPSIQAHDIEIKVNSIKKFITQGKRVLLSMQYKNRELMYREKGFSIIKDIILQVESIACVELNPKFEGTRLTCRLSPNPEVGEKNAP